MKIVKNKKVRGLICISTMAALFTIMVVISGTVSEAATTLFTTGLENGQTQPTWANTIDLVLT